MEVIITGYGDGEYHRHRSSFHTYCGIDFNPHEAERLEAHEALERGYEACRECLMESE